MNTLKRNVGLAFVPTIAVQEYLDQKQMVHLHWDHAPHETTIFMIRHMDKWCSPIVHRFMTMAEEVVLR